jgi:hypothetical protein
VDATESLALGDLRQAMTDAEALPPAAEVLVHLPDGAVLPLASAGWDSTCDGVDVFRLFVGEVSS